MKYECLFPIRKESSIFSLNLAFWLLLWLACLWFSVRRHFLGGGGAARRRRRHVLYNTYMVQQGVGAKTIPKEPNERKKKLPTHSFYIVHSEAIYSFRDNADATPRAAASTSRAPPRHAKTPQLALLLLFNVSSNIPHVCLFGSTLDVWKTKENWWVTD